MNGYANEEYIQSRNKLIPIAERYANEQFKDETDRKGWDRVFILKMDRLAVAAGLQAQCFHRQSKAVIRAERNENELRS